MSGSAPIINGPQLFKVTEGVDHVFTFTVSDPDSGNSKDITLAIDWGDGTSGSVTGTGPSLTINHTYASSGVYTISADASDPEANSANYSIPVKVAKAGGVHFSNSVATYLSVMGFEHDDPQWDELESGGSKFDVNSWAAGGDVSDSLKQDANGGVVDGASVAKAFIANGKSTGWSTFESTERLKSMGTKSYPFTWVEAVADGFGTQDALILGDANIGTGKIAASLGMPEEFVRYRIESMWMAGDIDRKQYLDNLHGTEHERIPSNLLGKSFSLDELKSETGISDEDQLVSQGYIMWHGARPFSERGNMPAFVKATLSPPAPEPLNLLGKRSGVPIDGVDAGQDFTVMRELTTDAGQIIHIRTAGHRLQSTPEVDATSAINALTSAAPGLLEELFVVESAGENRAAVISAIQAKATELQVTLPSP